MRDYRRNETPDGRPGVRVLMFAMSTERLQKQLSDRVGQCVLTCPARPASPGSTAATTAQARRRAPLFRRRLADLEAARRPALLAHSGHGRRVPLRSDDRHHEESGRRRQSPVMGRDAPRRRCAAAEAAVAAMRKRRRTSSCPFRRHRALRLQGRLEIQGHDRLDQRRLLPDAEGRASTAALDADVGCVLEIVIDGLTAEAVARGDAGRPRARSSNSAPSGRGARRRRQLRRQARPAPLSSEGAADVSALTFSLKAPPARRLDLRAADARSDFTT